MKVYQIVENTEQIDCTHWIAANTILEAIIQFELVDERNIVELDINTIIEEVSLQEQAEIIIYDEDQGCNISMVEYMEDCIVAHYIGNTDY